MSINLIKEIRQTTGLSFKDIKKAVDELKTDNAEEIVTYLRKQGTLKAAKRQDRETNQGGVFTYVHDGRIGVLVVINCETDFVSRGDDFKQFGNDIALHIAAYQPKFISPDEMDAEFVKKELDIAKDQLLNEGKPEDKIEMILKGKEAKLGKENSLVSQGFIKDPTKSIDEVITELSATTGEKIVISQFEIVTL